ncbi:MAG: tRNA threonylcarbamoyladenosine dehydratase [Lachnospiraceae bacterium]|nr:tRNA threonylcarbamoyladenosine dehydratase [Lachnospiraceae bacterium]
MSNQFSRTELLFGKEAMEKLLNARVAVFGIGGVGGHTLEALVRSGVGTVDIIDNDTVCLSNLNRQLIATHKTIGQYKVDAAQQRMEEINPDVVIHKHRTFFLPETADQFNFAQYDYIVDAIDTVTGKLELAVRAKQAGVPIISSMGAGNKVDPTAFEVADIYETSVCPLAKVMRRELKKRGIDKLKVVYSREPARTPIEAENVEETEEENGKSGVQIFCGEPARRRQIPGSNAFVPSVAGLIMAGEVIKGLL